MVDLSIPEDWYQRPNIARIYDYWLDGTQHFPVDREVADRMDAAHPHIRTAVMSNRLFLRRAVSFLAGQGIEQFLDLGTGLPTGGNVHTIALSIRPKARVAYVDNDPLVVRLSQLLLQEERVGAQVIALLGDVNEPEALFAHPTLAERFDFQQPIALLLFGLLYFIPDDEQVVRILRSFHDRMAPGSYLAFSHLDFEALPDDSAEEARRIYEGSVTRIKPRTIAEVTELLKDFEMVEPGVVFIPAWRPLPAIQSDPYAKRPEQASMVGGIGRKVE
jgi:O-methyltransferase involved in polyketide biosynthesis